MKEKIKRFIRITILGILAGLLISIGCIVNVQSGNKYIGALAFSCGLFFICECKFKLYTGAIGYLLSNKKEDNIDLIFILLGNFLGCLIMASLISFTRIGNNVRESCALLTETKLNDTPISVFLLACFCGVMIYLGVDTFKKSANPLSTCLALIYAVFVFIISSYEHCIANMFYIMASNTWSLKAVLYILIMILGNSVGGVFIPLCLIMIKKLS